MNKQIGQIGPSQIYICKGCTELKTHVGSHQAHHKCHDKAWPSVKQTEINEYPKTPDTCPYK